MMRAHLKPFIALSLLAFAANTYAGQTPPLEPAEPIGGALVIHGGGPLPARILEAFIKLAGGEQAKIVVIPTASDTAETIDEEKELAHLKKRGVASAVILHTRSRDKANESAFVEPLRTATAVWFGGGAQTNLENAYVGTEVEKELHALLKRGGVIGGSSAGAAIMSRVMMRRGNPEAEMGTGLGFLPSVVLDQHFTQRNRAERLHKVLKDHPGLAGIGIDEGTALLVRGRQMGVLGDGTVSICFSASPNRNARIDVLKENGVADLVAVTRTAIARTQPAFPPAGPLSPEVDGTGTLVIIGGPVPPEAPERFVKAAGGPDALIVMISTALGDDPPAVPGEIRLLQRAGAKNIKILHAKNRIDADKPEILDVLKEAKGLWFCGGRQWRLVDSFLGTEAEKLMHEVVRRGGAVGGSSAGATIQGDYLVRGNPLGNLQMMWEGYERGFAFLKHIAIDQHFAQRNRFADMTELKKTFPQLIGIGVDENAAAIVTGHVMEVVGTSNVQVYDLEKPPADGAKDYQVIKPGEFYDFKTRKKIEPAEKKP